MKKPAFKSLIAALLIIGILLPVMTLFAPVAFAAGGEVTEVSSTDGYVIPEEFTDADKYPFLLFVDGQFIDANNYTSDPFNEVTGSLGRYVRFNTSAGQNAVIIAQRDFTVTDANTGYFQTNYIKSNVTIDLMGHTVTNVGNTNTANLISSNATQTINTSFSLKNGTLILAKGLLSVSNGGGEKTQNFTFENLDIVSYNKELLVFNQYKTAGDVNIDFINCDIVSASDSTNPLGNVFRSGNAADTNGYFNAKTTVKGGSVTLTSFNEEQFVQEYNGSTVAFLPDDNGNMTRVIVPTGTTVSDEAYRGNNESLYLVKDKANETTDEYVMESLVTPYGTIPYTYSDKTLYPFLAFCDGAFVELDAGKSYDLFYGNVAGTIERKTRFMSGISSVNVVLRKDYTVVKYSGVSGTGQLLTNYQKVPFNLDLMGHTLTSEISTPLFGSNGASSDALNTVLTVKNGRIVTNKEPVTIANKPGVEGKSQSFIFENVDIVTTATSLVIYNTTNTNIKGVYNISYINCNITFNNNNDNNVFNASNANGYITNTISVKGGSVTLNKFNESKFVATQDGCAVKFLPNENGEYLTVNVLGSTEATVGSTYTTESSGEMNLVYFGTKDGYGVYYLRNAEKLIKPKTSLTMHSSFVYNVYIPAKDFITSITLGDVTYTELGSLPTRDFDGVSYYRIEKSIGVNSAGEDFTLTVTGDVQKQSWNLSVISYANKLVNGSYTDVEKALAKDILAYVRAAYVYADSENADDVKSEIDTIIGSDYAVNPDTRDEAKKSVDGLDSASLMLGDSPAFIFYPETVDGATVYDTAAYKFSVNGARATTVTTTVNGKTAILVYTYAYAITETVTYTVEGTDISGEYNLRAYLDFTESTSDENLVALVKALWQYSDSAAAYRLQEITK